MLHGEGAMESHEAGFSPGGTDPVVMVGRQGRKHLGQKADACYVERDTRLHLSGLPCVL